MSDEPSGPGARPNSSVRASHDSDGRDSAAGVLMLRAEVDRRPPRVAGRCPRRHVEILRSLRTRVRVVGREHHLAPVLAHVRLDVVARAVELAHRRGGAEAVARRRADEEVARHGRGAAREEQLLRRPRPAPRTTGPARRARCSGPRARTRGAAARASRGRDCGGSGTCRPSRRSRPRSTRRLTNSSRPPRSGVGQKSSAAELIGAGRFSGAPNGLSTLSRCATQMSSPPLPPGRLDAMNRLRPSGERIGQPSSDGVLIRSLLPATSSTLTGLLQTPSAWALAAAAKSAATAAHAATTTNL